MSVTERNPEPEAILSARKAGGFTQTEAANLIGASLRTWQAWEAGERRMPASKWDLFQIQVRGTDPTANLPAIAVDGAVLWYAMSKATGMMTLCASEADARRECAAYDNLYPRGAPHIPTRLIALDR